MRQSDSKNNVKFIFLKFYLKNNSTYVNGTNIYSHLYVTAFLPFAPKLNLGVFGGELLFHGTIFKTNITF